MDKSVSYIPLFQFDCANITTKLFLVKIQKFNFHLAILQALQTVEPSFLSWIDSSKRYTDRTRKYEAGPNLQKKLCQIKS